jgi:hypothetical protein
MQRRMEQLIDTLLKRLDDRFERDVQYSNDIDFAIEFSFFGESAKRKNRQAQTKLRVNLE